jgi:hypothetical protein
LNPPNNSATNFDVMERRWSASGIERKGTAPRVPFGKSMHSTVKLDSQKILLCKPLQINGRQGRSRWIKGRGECRPSAAFSGQTHKYQPQFFFEISAKLSTMRVRFLAGTGRSLACNTK